MLHVRHRRTAPLAAAAKANEFDLARCSREYRSIRGDYSMILQNGRPASAEGREEKEMKTYDVLDELGIKYSRTDHGPVGTIADCLEV